jgi:hypothetical protein
MFNNLQAFAVALLAGSAAAIDLKTNDERRLFYYIVSKLSLT